MQAMCETQGPSESAADAGNAAGLLRIYSVLSLPPTRAPMVAQAVMMHQRRWTMRGVGSNRQSEGKGKACALGDIARRGRINQASAAAADPWSR